MYKYEGMNTTERNTKGSNFCAESKLCKDWKVHVTQKIYLSWKIRGRGLWKIRGRRLRLWGCHSLFWTALKGWLQVTWQIFVSDLKTEHMGAFSFLCRIVICLDLWFTVVKIKKWKSHIREITYPTFENTEIIGYCQ